MPMSARRRVELDAVHVDGNGDLTRSKAPRMHASGEAPPISWHRCCFVETEYFHEVVITWDDEDTSRPCRYDDRRAIEWSADCRWRPSGRYGGMAPVGRTEPQLHVGREGTRVQLAGRWSEAPLEPEPRGGALVDTRRRRPSLHDVPADRRDVGCAAQSGRGHC